MTAEIAIMNKEAIALAADSAVTMGGGESEKIFTSANKLFALSKYQPVGIMVYGSAIFMGVPWETIIKVYRNNLVKKKFNALKEYTNNFIQFLDNGNPLFPDSVQDEYVKSSIYSYFNFVRRQITEKVYATIDEESQINDESILHIVSQLIKGQYEEWEKTDNVPSIPKSFNRNILKKYEEVIDEAIREVFEELPIAKRDLNRLKKIAVSLFSKFPENIEKEDLSGVVIAGFGEKDTFPSLESFDIEGIVNNKLKYEERHTGKIDFEVGASIIPFAQREMVSTFMEGVDPFYLLAEEGYLSKIFNDYAEMVVDSITRYTDKEKGQLKEKLNTIGKEILDDYNKRLEEHRKVKYVNPILDVVSMLPKDELAAMAESLVNLTSFKRRVTKERETVGGPIDVAVISKGDGFIWIKRKHYFKAELNPQFLANYYKEGPNEQK